MSAPIAPPAPPFLGPAKFHGGHQAGPFKRIVIHCTVSPCKAGGARDVARYFRKTVTRPSSAHYVVDPFEVVQVVPDHTVAYHAPPNLDTLGVELCDPQAGPSSRWNDDLHMSMLRLAARLVANLALAYDVPIQKLGPRDLVGGLRGICGHVDVSNAFHESTHTDPGDGFPWGRFMRLVREQADALQRPPETMLRVGQWNVQRGHPPTDHATMMLNAFDAERLDVLLLQEMADYIGPLRHRLKVWGHALVAFTDTRGSRDCAILVRRGLDIGRTWSFDAGTGWFTHDGAEHAPAHPVAAFVEGVMFVSVHAPVSVNWRAGVPFGPLRRVAAYIGHSRKLGKLFEHHRGIPMCVAGDWNATPTDRGIATPHAVAKGAGAVLHNPGESTGHGPIDYPITRDLQLDHLAVTGKRLSDHKLVRYDVHAAAPAARDSQWGD